MGWPQALKGDPSGASTLTYTPVCLGYHLTSRPCSVCGPGVWSPIGSAFLSPALNDHITLDPPRPMIPLQNWDTILLQLEKTPRDLSECKAFCSLFGFCLLFGVHFDLHQRLRRIKWVFLLIFFNYCFKTLQKLYIYKVKQVWQKGFLFLAHGSLVPFLMDGDICELCHNRYLLLQYPTLWMAVRNSRVGHLNASYCLQMVWGWAKLNPSLFLRSSSQFC